jgi:hypothetical protein
MAVTAFETAEQRLPCHVEQAADAAANKVAAEQAVPLQEADHGGADLQRPADRDDIWNMIQSQKPAPPKQAPYVHAAPVRRSSSLLTQKSLEICTESLGSETGSDGFSDADRSCPGSDDDADCGEAGADGVAARAPPPRAFPPPLPSLARRTVGSLQTRQHRRGGRLVVEAVPVLSNTLFRAQRRGGRLLLSFADTAAPASDEEKNNVDQEETDQKEADEQAQDEDDDSAEEVQVVDRGTVVEVKVSTQSQANNSGARVHRSSLVINKFVGAESVNTPEITAATPPKPTTLSATAPLPEDYGTTAPPGEGKVLMTTRQRRSKQEVLNHMRRCGQLSGRLFIWEPRVATSS